MSFDPGEGYRTMMRMSVSAREHPFGCDVGGSAYCKGMRMSEPGHQNHG
jgi:hypothetical protein